MSNKILHTLAEAQAVYRKHAAEQAKEGFGAKPDAWVNIGKTSLVVVVLSMPNESLRVKPYEYALRFPCEGIHQILEPPPKSPSNGGKKDPEHPLKHLRQLHMFKPA